MSTTTADNRGFAKRARTSLNAARREATAPRLATVGVLALGAAAFSLLRNPQRRQRLAKSMRELYERMPGRADHAPQPQAPNASQPQAPNASAIMIG
jgi:hypothetical protein